MGENPAPIILQNEAKNVFIFDLAPSFPHSQSETRGYSCISKSYDSIKVLVYWIPE